ncbi:hypothetical protein ASZ90_009248 [hydrocarbon metagenome]|uniref:Uncharacterized protein n=1 Tax=hydrocarbon metagenome TaxID=938273 RepID=A0A0W8FJD4_9ZZZZ
MCAGCCTAEVLPSPNSQSHPVGLPAEVSLNRTASGAVPAVTFAVKFAAGGTIGAGCVNAFRQTFVSAYDPARSVHTVPFGLTKLSPEPAAAPELYPDRGCSTGIG